MTRWLLAAQEATDLGTEPTKPMQRAIQGRADSIIRGALPVSSVLSVLSEGKRADRGSPDPDSNLDLYEERAAIREFDGGQARADAEAAALAKAARAAGMTPEALRGLWAAHPDARAYLAHLTRHGPQTYGAMASLMGWGATRAWLAEARLRAAGLIAMGPQGVAVPATRAEGRP